MVVGAINTSGACFGPTHPSSVFSVFSVDDRHPDP
jgi:hypothetical protein